MELSAGTNLQNGKYRIIKSLGSGGFGITYLAEQVLAERMVCIKEFFPKQYYKRDGNTQHASIATEGNVQIMDAFKLKFMKEARTIARLDHPNIIHIHDIFEENGTAYYVMEYIEGRSILDVLKEHGAFDEAQALQYVRQTAAALQHIHNERIVHLDVKPANILLRANGRVVLIDFGLAKQYNEEGNQTSSTPVGISHGYAPIEQYQNSGVSQFSPESDIYSLGATLYTLVIGKIPPTASSILENGLHELPEHLSTSTKEAIRCAMQPRRKDRPATIEAFLAILDSRPVVKDSLADSGTSIDSGDETSVSVHSTPEIGATNGPAVDTAQNIATPSVGAHPSSGSNQQHNAGNNANSSGSVSGIQSSTPTQAPERKFGFSSKVSLACGILALILSGSSSGWPLFIAFIGAIFGIVAISSLQRYAGWALLLNVFSAILFVVLGFLSSVNAVVTGFQSIF